jgi:hypothetical protein
MKLEDQLMALMRQNNVCSLSLHLTLKGDGELYFYDAIAHGEKANKQSICASTDLKQPTLASAVSMAIGALNEMRAVGVVKVGELSEMGDAA